MILLATLAFLCLVFNAEMTSPTHDVESRSYSTCRPGWTPFQDSCFATGKDAVTFGEALATCISYRARLATPDSREKSDFLKTLARSTGGHVWIAGTDVFQEANWVWAETMKYFWETYTDWDSVEPNGAGTENCVVMYTTQNYHWADVSCTMSNYFICEYTHGDQLYHGQ